MFFHPPARFAVAEGTWVKVSGCTTAGPEPASPRLLGVSRWERSSIYYEWFSFCCCGPVRGCWEQTAWLCGREDSFKKISRSKSPFFGGDALECERTGQPCFTTRELFFFFFLPQVRLLLFVTDLFLLCIIWLFYTKMQTCKHSKITKRLRKRAPPLWNFWFLKIFEFFILT